MLDRLAKRNADKVRIIKVDASKNRQWAMAEKVRGVPTFQLYRGGVMVDQFVGAYPEKTMQGKIDKLGMTTTSSGSEGKKSQGEKEGAKKEPAIKPMPKNWLPPGVKQQ